MRINQQRLFQHKHPDTYLLEEKSRITLKKKELIILVDPIIKVKSI